MTNKISAVLCALAIAAAVMFTATATPAPATAQGTSSDVYHTPVGNDQAFGVNCSNGSGPYWVQKSQFAWNKCWDLANHSYVVSIYMPANYMAWCKLMGTDPNWKYLVSGGSTVAIWGNAAYQCYTQHY